MPASAFGFRKVKPNGWKSLLAIGTAESTDQSLIYLIQVMEAHTKTTAKVE